MYTVVVLSFQKVQFYEVHFNVFDGKVCFANILQQKIFPSDCLISKTPLFLTLLLQRNSKYDLFSPILVLFNRYVSLTVLRRSRCFVTEA